MNVRVSTLFQAIVLATMSFVALAYLASDMAHSYFDAISILLIEVIGVTLYISGGKLAERFPESIVVSATIYVFVLLRLAVLVIIPESLLHGHATTAEFMNNALFFILFGMIAGYLGLASGGSLGEKRRTSGRIIQLTGERQALQVIFLLLLLSVLSEVLQYFLLGYMGTSSDKSEFNFFSRYISVLISPVPFSLLFFLVWTTEATTLKSKRLLFWMLITTFLGSVLMGSRGTTLFILLLWFSSRLILDGNFKAQVNLKNIAISFCVILLLAFLFFFALIFRALRYTENIDLESAFSSIAASTDLHSVLMGMISDISYRLSAIESVNFVVSWQEYGLRDVSNLINFETSILNAVERIIPGSQFDRRIFSEFAYGFMFYSDGVVAISDDGRLDLTGYEWNIFGLSYQLFGGYGGVLFIFISFLFLGYSIRKFISIGGIYGVGYAIFLTWSLNAWVQNLGFDNFVARTVLQFLSLTLSVFIVTNFVPKFQVIRRRVLKSTRLQPAIV